MRLKVPPGFPLLAVEGIITILFGVVALSLVFVTPTPRQFFERDATISFALEEETIPMWFLLLLAIFLPLLTIGVCHCPIMCRSCRLENFVTHVVPYSSLAQTLIMANLITNVLKVYAGRRRPNFFALCDYRGYRTAIESGDMSIYFANTEPGALGSIANCQASPREIHEAQLSFPSGHATTAWAGLGFLALYILATIRPQNRFLKLLRDVAVGGIVGLAAFISASRCHDYFHNFDDVAVGSIIGSVSAYAMWAFQRSLRGAPTGIPLQYTLQSWPRRPSEDNNVEEELVPSSSSSRAFASAYPSNTGVIGCGPELEPWSLCGDWAYFMGKNQGAMAVPGSNLRGSRHGDTIPVQ